MTAAPVAPSTVRHLLGEFLPPNRADRLADRSLPDAVALLRTRYDVGDEQLVLALDDAGVPSATTAALTGLDVRTVNELVDVEEATPLVPRWRSPVPRGLELAGRTVRIGWIVLAVAAVAVVVQSRGGLVACDRPVCIEAVEVERTDATLVDPGEGEVLDQDEVAAVRFHHRTGDGRWDGVLRWTVDGDELSVEPVELDGVGVLRVPPPPGPVPPGVHVVQLEDAGPAAVAVFAVER